MGKYLNPDNSSFRRRLTSRFFVDKSGMLAKISDSLFSSRSRICVTKPVGFGKTYACDAIAAYYSCGCDSRELFDGLRALEGANAGGRNMNGYNVVYLGLGEAMKTGRSLKSALKYIKKELTAEIKAEYKNAGIRDKTISGYFSKICAYGGKSFIFIIDDWDAPVRGRKRDEKAVKEIADFIDMLSGDGKYVALTYITGTCPISKTDGREYLSDFTEFSVINAGMFKEYMGFTNEDMETICARYGMPYAEMLKWYGGFTVNGTPYFNPKSVADAVSLESFDTYWADASVRGCLQDIISCGVRDTESAAVRLIAGFAESVDILSVSEGSDSYENINDPLAMMAYSGFVTYDSAKKAVEIPNRETRQIFIAAADSFGWTGVTDAVKNSDKFLDALLRKNPEALEYLVNDLSIDRKSFPKSPDETMYAGAIALSFSEANRDYEVHREMPSAYGSAAMSYVPLKSGNLPAFTVEVAFGKNAPSVAQKIREGTYPASFDAFCGEVITVQLRYVSKLSEYKCTIETYHKSPNGEIVAVPVPGTETSDGAAAAVHAAYITAAEEASGEQQIAGEEPEEEITHVNVARPAAGEEEIAWEGVSPETEESSGDEEPAEAEGPAEEPAPADIIGEYIEEIELFDGTSALAGDREAAESDGPEDHGGAGKAPEDGVDWAEVFRNADIAENDEDDELDRDDYEDWMAAPVKSVDVAGVPEPCGETADEAGDAYPADRQDADDIDADRAEADECADDTEETEKRDGDKTPDFAGEHGGSDGQT